MTTVYHQSGVPSPATITRLGGSSGTLYIFVPGAGRVPLDVRRVDPQKLQDHEAKVQAVWNKVKSQLIGVENVKVNMSRLFVSYTDTQGKTQYIDLGANVDGQYKDLQKLVVDVRSSVEGICDCFKWKSKEEDASNRPIGTERPFSSETSPKKLCESQKQFMTDGSFDGLTECLNQLEGRTSPPDKAKTRKETQERIEASEAFTQKLRENVAGLIGDYKKKKGEKEGEKKDLEKEMGALDKEIKNIVSCCNKLSAKANAGDRDAQTKLESKIGEKDNKDKRKADLQKKIDQKAGEIEENNKQISQLEQFKKEIQEMDRYACYWAVGVGSHPGLKEDRFARANAITDNISRALSNRKVGFFRGTSLEPSVIRTYAEEVGDLVIRDRLEYIERFENSNEARESAGLMRRSERGSSVEGLVTMAAIDGFDENKMGEVSKLAGFSRFDSSLQGDLLKALQTACSSSKPKLAASSSSTGSVATPPSAP